MELRAPKPERRYQAVRELAQIPSSNIEPLLRLALDDPTPFVKTAAAEVVAQQRYALSEQVIPWLSADVNELKWAAVRVLTSVPLESATESLRLLLFDKDAELRRLVVAALAELTSPLATETLRVALDDSNDWVRKDAVRSLASRIDSRIDSALSSKLSDIEPSVRADVVTALMARGGLTDDTLLRQTLTDQSANVRIAVIRSLARRRDEGTTQRLFSLVSAEKSPQVLREVIETLALQDVRVVAPELFRIGLGLSPGATRDVVQEAISEHLALAREVSRLCFSSPEHSNSADCLQFCKRGGCSVSTLPRLVLAGQIPTEVALDIIGKSASSEGLDFTIGCLDFESKRHLTRALVALERILEVRSNHWVVDALTGGLVALRADEPDYRRVVRLLGMSGSPRAKTVLLAIARDATLPAAVVEEAILALGRLGAAGLDTALLSLLNHENERVALAVATVFFPTNTALSPLGLFEQSDRGPTRRALRFIVLSSMLASTTDSRVWPEVARRLTSVAGEERDALLEGIARNSTTEAQALLARLRGQMSTSDRRKIAEAWGGDDSTLDELVRLVRDPVASVRAQAITSLGQRGNERHRELLVQALAEPFLGVRVNAMVALGQIAKRNSMSIETEICSFLTSRNLLLQEAALTALYLARTRCRPGQLERKFLRSKAESVRFAAARLVASAPLAQDEMDLALCSGFDVSPRVRRTCRGMTNPSEENLATSPPRLIYVVPAGQSMAAAGTPFLVSDEMGLFRIGITDRRGASFVDGSTSRGKKLRLVSSDLLLLDEREIPKR